MEILLHKKLKFLLLLFMKYLIFFILIFLHFNSFSREEEFIRYQVKRYDTIENILKRYKLRPVYGKNGSFKKFLDLNPQKYNAKGNLIYPGEEILLPLPKTINNQTTTLNSINNEFSTSVKNKYINQNISAKIPDLASLPEGQVYMVYKVKKNDMISMLLQKFGTTPIYGKKGNLLKTLELNPLKKETKGDLIYPNEYIILPIPLEILLSLSDSDKNDIQILIDKPLSTDHKNIKNKKTLISYEEFKKNQQEVLSLNEKIKDKNIRLELEKEKTSEEEFNPEEQKNKSKEEKLLSDEQKNKDQKSILSNYSINLIGNLKKDMVQLNWKPIKSKTPLKYHLLRSNTSSIGYKIIPRNPKSNNYIDKNIKKGSIYFYKLSLESTEGETIFSNEVMIKVPLDKLKLQIKLDHNLITLNWSKIQGNLAILYEIKRSLTSGKNYITIANNIQDHSYIDRSAQNGYKYFYIISTQNKEIDVTTSNEVSLITNPELPKTINLKLDKNNHVVMEWQKNTSNLNLRYEIKRSLISKQNYKKIAEDLTENNYIDQNPIPGNKLYYIITAINDEGNETNSEEVSITTAPLAPTNLTATLENKSILLQWKANESNTEIVYEIKRSEISGEEYQTVANRIFSTNYTDTNINPENKYYYIVVAKTEGGESENSNEASVLSYDGRHIPSSLRTDFGIRYLTLKEYNLQNNSYADLYSAASPSISVDQIQNWEDNLITYLGIGDLYLDMQKSPIYLMQNRQFHLFNAHSGVEYETPIHLYLQDEFSIGQDVVYQSVGYNTMQDQTVYLMNNKLLLGYTFFQVGTLKAQTEAAYLFAAPLSFQGKQFGNGYEGAIKITQQNSRFKLGTRIFYTDRTTITNQVKSNVIEFGIMGELSLELGYQ